MNRFEQFFKLDLDKPFSLDTINSLALQKIGQAFTEAMGKAFDANLMDAHKLGTPNAQQAALKKTLLDINEFVAKAAQNNPEVFSVLMPKN